MIIIINNFLETLKMNREFKCLKYNKLNWSNRYNLKFHLNFLKTIF